VVVCNDHTFGSNDDAEPRVLNPVFAKPKSKVSLNSRQKFDPSAGARQSGSNQFRHKYSPLQAMFFDEEPMNCSAGITCVSAMT
jgi:hypothetical protein